MTTEKPIFPRVKQVLVAELGVPEEKVTEEAEVEAHLGADSLGVVEIILGLEEEFQVEIDDRTAEEWTTVGDIVRGLAKIL